LQEAILGEIIIALDSHTSRRWSESIKINQPKEMKTKKTN